MNCLWICLLILVGVIVTVNCLLVIWHIITFHELISSKEMGQNSVLSGYPCLLPPAAWCYWHQSCWVSVMSWPPLSEENRRKQFSPESPPSLLPENEDGLLDYEQNGTLRRSGRLQITYTLMSLLMMITVNDAFTVFQSQHCVKSYVFPHYSAHEHSFLAISDILISRPCLQT